MVNMEVTIRTSKEVLVVVKNGLAASIRESIPVRGSPNNTKEQLDSADWLQNSGLGLSRSGKTRTGTGARKRRVRGLVERNCIGF